jgi:hypothetical protein
MRWGVIQVWIGRQLSWLLAVGMAIWFSLAAGKATATGADPPSQPTAQAQERASMSTDHLDLTATAVTAKLAPKPAGKGERPPSVPDVVKGLAGDRKMYLVIRDLRTNTPPGVTYSIYLDLPADATPEVARKHFVGTFNFFNASVAPDPAKATKSDRFQSFDVTQLLKSLAAAGKLGEKVVVTVVPDELPDPQAKPRIGELTLSEQ